MGAFVSVSASIVLYNTKPSYIAQIYKCIIESTIEIQCTFVDNSPTPCIEPKDFPKADYIFLNGNRGYGSGHNVAIKKYIDTTDYHIILNPDINFSKDAISTLIAYLDAHKDVGQVMPNVFYPSGKLQRLCKLLPTPTDLLVRRFIPLKFVKDYINDRYELSHFSYAEELDVPSLSGCFMVLRNAALKEVGLFDERFFMYCEDLDLCRRIHAKYKTIFYPKVEIVHDHAKESYKNKIMLKHHITSTLKYFSKWGWFCDKERKMMNKRVLRDIEVLKAIKNGL